MQISVEYYCGMAEFKTTRQQQPVYTVNVTRHCFVPCARLTSLSSLAEINFLTGLTTRGVSTLSTGHSQGIMTSRYCGKDRFPAAPIYSQRRYNMNGRSQMQCGKNWILPKKINANRFFGDSHWLENWINN